MVSECPKMARCLSHIGHNPESGVGGSSFMKEPAIFGSGEVGHSSVLDRASSV